MFEILRPGLLHSDATGFQQASRFPIQTVVKTEFGGKDREAGGVTAKQNPPKNSCPMQATLEWEDLLDPVHLCI